MSKSAIVVTIVILLTCLLIVFTAVLLKNYFPSVFSRNQTALKESLTESSVTTFISPVNPSDADIVSARLVYKVKGQIKSLTPDNNTTSIDLETKTNNLPGLTVTNKTQVFLDTNGKFTTKKLSDLKVGQNVNIFISYGLRTKRWTLFRINILEPKL